MTALALGACHHGESSPETAAPPTVTVPARADGLALDAAPAVTPSASAAPSDAATGASASPSAAPTADDERGSITSEDPAMRDCDIPRAGFIVDNATTTQLTARGVVQAVAVTAADGSLTAPKRGYVRFDYTVKLVDVGRAPTRPHVVPGKHSVIHVYQRAEAATVPRKVGSWLVFSACSTHGASSGRGPWYEPDVGYLFSVTAKPACDQLLSLVMKDVRAGVKGQQGASACRR